MRESHSEALFSKNSMLNSLVAGNLRVETGSIRAASATTQSCATGDFLKVYERPRVGGDLCDGSFSETAPLQSAGRFCAFFSGPEIPFPGNGDRERQRLRFESRLRRRKDFNFTLRSLDRRHAVTLELLSARTTLLQFGSIGEQHG